MKILPVLAAYSLFLVTLSSLPAAETANNSLEQGFAAPTESARPRTWWHWVSGNVSKEGITADLEAMKRVGIAGAQIFTVDQSSVKGPVVFMSPEWRGLIKHAMSEAKRLNLEISMEGCDGWSESGGHWVKPSESMQKVVWSEAQIQDGKNIPLALPQPETVLGYYDDIALLAFKTQPEDLVPDPMNVTTSSQLEKPVNGRPTAADPIKFSGDKGSPPFWIQYEFQAPVTTRSLVCERVSGPYKVFFAGKIQASDDGITFRDICTLGTHDNFVAFPAVTGKYFRISFIPTDRSKPNLKLKVSSWSFMGARVTDATARSGIQVKMNLPFDTNSASDPVINSGEIIDLTGKSSWDAPEGNWTLLRIGHTSTGATTHPSTTPGLECDKLSTADVNSHIDHLFKPVWEDSPDKAGSTFKFILLDSWEAGCENWTPLMAEEFRKRRGYDLMPWLPALTGRIIGSVDETERFLWDYRRTLADLVAENHYGVFQKRAHEKGMGLMSEATGIGMPTVADQLLCKKYCDVPMGEFWVNHTRDGNIDDPKEAASAAHLYGQNIASCESFTSTPQTAAWKNDPYSLKALGDEEFCNGVNRFIFHRYAHQPWLDRVPGMSMGPWGINFERTNTWWNQGSAWIAYLSRCQYLLQQGRFCADLCYFYGEGAPSCVHHAELNPEVPKGYDYDVCNADILLNLMGVKDGRITTPSGMSYRVLVLPPDNRMTLPVLRKVAKLVEDGATVYGQKPEHSPSLTGYPDSEVSLSKLASEVWGACDGKSVTSNSYGNGRVVLGEPLEKVLGVPPDFIAKQGDFLFIHRKIAHDESMGADTEVYFVSNQERKSMTVDCAFRVIGKIPELWHPDTGKRETVALYKTDKDITTIPITFDPFGSVFVVFQKNQTSTPHPLSLAVATNEKKTDHPSPADFEILKATYGAEEKIVDVTTTVASMITNGTLSMHVDTTTLKVPDPAPNVVKQLILEYKLNGETATMTIPERKFVNLEATPSYLQQASLRTDSQKKITLSAWQNGNYTVTMSDGSTQILVVEGLPDPLPLEGPWSLVFPPMVEGKGEPMKTTFEKLNSWSDSPVEFIKYFSGTATYTKTFTLPKEYLGKDRLYLDLGNVKNIAQVSLNGKPLGILWKEPFRVEITTAVKPGKNHLEIKLTNLWPNRLIGDQKLPESQRVTWSSVSLYKADSPLLTSGLLGPVKIIPAREISF